MAELLTLALSYPSVVFTVLLGVVLVYWSFVIVGVLHIGEGSDGALDGLGDGHLEGAAKGVLEGHLAGSKGLGGHGADAGDGDWGDADGDLGDSAHTSTLAALLGALHLRSAPVTVVLSVLITFSWLVCVVAMQAVTRMFEGPPGLLWSLLALCGAPLVALPMTSLAVRPLAKFFVPRNAPANSSFIGRTCVVRTGSVTRKFGEATLEDGGAGLVLRIRVDGEAAMSRGEHALIVDYDAERETYLVEPISELLPRAGKSSHK